jgi:hypothetical protein
MLLLTQSSMDLKISSFSAGIMGRTRLALELEYIVEAIDNLGDL